MVELIGVLRWISRHRPTILAGLGGLTVGYGILITIVPWRFCHAEAYVISSIAVISLLALEVADLRERHDHRR